MSREIWKPVRHYEDTYFVSNFGNVRNVKFNFDVAKYERRKGDGYISVKLRRDGNCKMKFVHRLVLESFIGPCPEGMECCHKNNIKSDNRLANLIWDTHKNNIMKDTRGPMINGFLPGEKNRNTSLTDEKVRDIHKLRRKKVKFKNIASKYNMTVKGIEQIVYGVTWKRIYNEFH